MAAASQQQVENIYLAYYGRAADPAGLAYWESQLINASGNLNTIINAFATSAEATALYGALSSTQQITAIYMTLFGHTADTVGMAYYQQGLASGAFTLGTVALNIFNGTSGTDQAVVAAKMAYSQAFTSALQGSSTAQNAAYTGTTAANNGRSVMSGVQNAATEQTGMANLPTILPTIGSSTFLTTPPSSSTSTSSSTSSNTFTLTTGVDSGAAFTGAAGGVNVFNAVLGPVGTATLTASDSLTGGAGGTNTLNITNATASSAIDTTLVTGLAITGIQTVNVQGQYTVKVDSTGWSGTTALNILASTGADVIKAAPTTALTVSDTGLGSGVTSIAGGSTINATIAGVTFGSASPILIGSATTSGAITATVTDANSGLTNVTGSAITVTGGTTVSLTHNITAAASGAGAHTSTGGTITVNGTVATTAVTVMQTAAVAATGVNGAVGQTENVGFWFENISSGQSITIGGLTFTDTTAINYDNLANVFSHLSNGATTGGGTGSGTYSGTLTGFTSGGDSSGGDITFTSVTPTTNVPDLVYSSTSPSNFMLTGYTQGSASVSGVSGSGGIADGAVHIADANAGSTTQAATITSVSLANYGAGSTISSNALANLSLSGTAGTLGITSGLTSETVRTLNLTVNGLSNAPGTTDAITDSSNHYTTIAVTTATADSTIANFTDTAATALTVAGTNALTFTFISGLSALQTVTVSGSAGLTANVSGIAAITDINASATSGNNTITMNAAQTTYEGGSGVDTVIDSAVATKAISGGAGSADVINLVGTGGTILTSVTGALLTGFEVLDATGGRGTFDASLIAGITAVQTGVDAASVSFINAAATDSLSLLAATGYTTNYSLVAGANLPSATLNLNLGTATTTGIANTLDISPIGTLNIASNGAGTGVDSLVLVDSGVTALTVSGAESLTLTGLTSNTIATVTDTQAAGLIFTLTTAATTPSGATVIDGAANLVFTGAATGTHTDSITAGNGNNTINDAAGNDMVTLGNGTNMVNLLGAGNQTLTVGTGANTVAVGSGQNQLTFAAHASGTVDTLTLGTAASATTYSVVAGLQHNDSISFGTDTTTFQGGTAASAQISLMNTPTFANIAATRSSSNSTARVRQHRSRPARTTSSS